MKKTTMPSRALMSTIAISLAVTMNPAAAFAADLDASSASFAAGVSESGIEQQADSTADAPALPVAQQSSAADSSSAARIHEEAIEDDVKANVISATVAVAEQTEAAPIVQQNGLCYQLSADAAGRNVATLVNVQASANQTTLNIPETIEANGVIYTVTNICLMGGGYSLFAANAVSTENATAEADAVENPYITEYFVGADKAAGVTSLIIPATVEVIDVAFFQLLPDLADISVADGSTHYSSYNGMLFANNEANEPVDLLLVPEGMEGEAVLPETMATVPACVFSRCTKLTAISVAYSTGSAVSSAFISQDGILYTNDLTTLVAAPSAIGASVVIAPECVAIGEGAFWGITDLTTIVAGGAVTDIFAGVEVQDEFGQTELIAAPAFNSQIVENATVALMVPADEFEAAQEVWLAAGFTNFTEPAQVGAVQQPESGNGFAYTLLDDYTLSVAWVGEDDPDADLVIPEKAQLNGVDYTVSAVAEEGFAGRESIVVVHTPATVTSIGASAFEGCTNLKTAALDDSVQMIDTRAFANAGLTTFVLPTGLQTLGDQALAGIREATIVDLVGTADIAATVLEGATRTQIYVPLNENNTYVWKTGIPAAGNALLPYGLRLGSGSYSLSVGQTTNLFDGSGYFEAPGNVYAICRYPARSFSIDTSTGTITALQEGVMRFNIWLALDIEVAQADGSTQTSEITLTTP